MMKKRLAAAGLAAIMVFGASMGAMAEETGDLLGADSAAVRFKVGTTTAPDGHYVMGLVEMQRLLEEYSNGEMTLDIYPNSELGGESDMMDAVSMGTQDMCLVSTGPIPSFSTATTNWSVLDLPYLFKNAEQAYEVLDGEVGQTLLSEFEGSGIYAVGFWENGFRELTNDTKEIAAPADLSGMKIRTMENSVHMATYSALGATPTAMAWSEIFSALQQGTVDGQENPLAIILTAKVYEVQKYVSMIDLFYSPCVLMISQDIYDGLSDEQKAAFDQAAEEAKDYQRTYSQEVALSAREEMEAQGVTFTDVDQAAWTEATASVYEDSSLGIDADMLAKIQAVTEK
ncbi:MAG: DctP family TRAP transporter solute-binding subunit [Lachnospiraceae bacterium]|nr:DctP family TRAP transporter solute-binding subunit [Lachnospiraceae bacterium]MDD3794459.1 DctP family TRAP transporter solute-binding subunit [Lachnospiraceae bacterium]